MLAPTLRIPRKVVLAPTLRISGVGALLAECLSVCPSVCHTFPGHSGSLPGHFLNPCVGFGERFSGCISGISLCLFSKIINLTPTHILPKSLVLNFFWNRTLKFEKIFYPKSWYWPIWKTFNMHFCCSFFRKNIILTPKSILPKNLVLRIFWYRTWKLEKYFTKILVLADLKTF